MNGGCPQIAHLLVVSLLRTKTCAHSIVDNLHLNERYNTHITTSVKLESFIILHTACGYDQSSSISCKLKSQELRTAREEKYSQNDDQMR